MELLTKDLDFHRGDTMPFKVKLINKNGDSINENDIDTLFVTCRQLPSKTSPILFQKQLSDITIEGKYIHITFNPEDTENLDYGTYYFDIEITLNSGYRKTKLYEFELTEETTIHGGDE